jgi:hypothetical protein
MDVLAQLVGQDCTLWWQDATGERCKTESALQRGGEGARPYRVGYIDFGAEEVQRTHGANIFLAGRIELAVTRESNRGVALARPKSSAEARTEASRLSNDYDDVCIARA